MIKFLLAWFFITLFLFGLLAPLQAATFTVTKETDDDGPCTVDDCALREAILAANTLPGKDIVEIRGGTYPLTILDPTGGSDLTKGSLDISDPIELLGDESAPVTIVGDGKDRVFLVLDTEARFSNLAGFARELFPCVGSRRFHGFPSPRAM